MFFVLAWRMGLWVYCNDDFMIFP